MIPKNISLKSLISLALSGRMGHRSITTQPRDVRLGSGSLHHPLWVPGPTNFRDSYITRLALKVLSILKKTRLPELAIHGLHLESSNVFIKESWLILKCFLFMRILQAVLFKTI